MRVCDLIEGYMIILVREEMSGQVWCSVGKTHVRDLVWWMLLFHIML